jgi:hypothetical protein
VPPNAREVAAPAPAKANGPELGGAAAAAREAAAPIQPESDADPAKLAMSAEEADEAAAAENLAEGVMTLPEVEATFSAGWWCASATRVWVESTLAPEDVDEEAVEEDVDAAAQEDGRTPRHSPIGVETTLATEVVPPEVGTTFSVMPSPFVTSLWVEPTLAPRDVVHIVEAAAPEDEAGGAPQHAPPKVESTLAPEASGEQASITAAGAATACATAALATARATLRATAAGDRFFGMFVAITISNE